MSTMNLKARQVTLSASVRAFARNRLVPEEQLKVARAGAATSRETPGFIVVDGELEATGQRIRFYCSPAKPEYVCWVRVLA